MLKLFGRFTIISLFISFTSYIISQDVQYKFDHILPYSDFYNPPSLNQFRNQKSIKVTSQAGGVTEQIDQMWNNNESFWHNDRRTTYVYYNNASGKLSSGLVGEIESEEFQQVWLTESWVNNIHKIKEVDLLAGISTTVTETWNGSEWDLETKTFSQGIVSTLDGFDSYEQITSVWVNGEWVNSERRVRIYHESNPDRLYSEEFEVWTENGWQPSYKKVYISDYQGTLTEVFWYRWENDELTLYRQEIYDYVPGKISSEQTDFNPYQILLKDLTNGVWTNVALWTYSYDADGDLTEDLWQSWNGQSWVNLSLTTYTREEEPLGKVVDIISVKRETLMLMKLWQNGLWKNFWRKLSSYEDSQVSVKEETELPNQFILHQNFPNPFNPTTYISYELNSNSRVLIDIYNLTGQHVFTLVDELQERGAKAVQWQGIDKLGRQVNSGIYFYKLQTGDFIQTRKMVLLK